MREKCLETGAGREQSKMPLVQSQDEEEQGDEGGHAEMVLQRLRCLVRAQAR